MIYIASAKFRVNVTWANSIKDRRQVAQKVRDWIKSKYNVSELIGAGHHNGDYVTIRSIIERLPTINRFRKTLEIKSMLLES